MLVHDQPVSIDLAVYIRDPDREVNWPPLEALAAEMLDAMAKTEPTMRRDIQCADFELHRTIEVSKELLPILPVRLRTDILAWGRRIEHNQRFVGHIDPHDGIDVFGTEGGSKPVFKCSDLGLVVHHGVTVPWQDRDACSNDVRNCGYGRNLLFVAMTDQSARISATRRGIGTRRVDPT